MTLEIGYADDLATCYLGDVREVMAQLPDESIHCVVTSPPYWGLRDYGVDGQIGLEANPADYLAQMVRVFREVRRVLRSDGTLWLNMGDSYAGARGALQRGNRNGDKSSTLDGGLRAKGRTISRRRDDAPIPRSDIAVEGLKPKDLVGMPWRLAFALQADGWYLRCDIVWSKPNPMPESVGDRPTKAHEYLFLLSKAERYFYDADAIREPLAAKTFTTFGIPSSGEGGGTGLIKSENWARDVPVHRPRLKRTTIGLDGGSDEHDRVGRNKHAQAAPGSAGARMVEANKRARAAGLPHDVFLSKRQNEMLLAVASAARRTPGINAHWEEAERLGLIGGANKRSVWTIATAPYPEAHFATFPEALLQPDLPLEVA